MKIRAFIVAITLSLPLGYRWGILRRKKTLEIWHQPKKRRSKMTRNWERYLHHKITLACCGTEPPTFHRRGLFAVPWKSMFHPFKFYRKVDCLPILESDTPMLWRCNKFCMCIFLSSVYFKDKIITKPHRE